MNQQQTHLGPCQGRIDARLNQWEQQQIGRRIWARDFTVWSLQPRPELVDRLGWLALPAAMPDTRAEIDQLASKVAGEGYERIVLIGMGGSSLAPEVFEQTIGHQPGRPPLTVLDSTHPMAVAAAGRAIDARRTLFLVSSKSGTTAETTALFRYCWSLVEAVDHSAGRHFIAITDPGTPLERLAAERAFRRTLKGLPDVGGRYSALSVFGLVPAALIGLDIAAVLDQAAAMARACGEAVAVRDNPALMLGAALAEAALAGRDKLTLIVPDILAALSAWIEQLVAESTGKDGKGIIPIVGETLHDPAAYSDDRVFVAVNLAGHDDPTIARHVAALAAAGHPVIAMTLEGPLALGQEFFRWELATAAAGAALGVNPFDQPDVQLAKDLARQAMAGATARGTALERSHAIEATNSQLSGALADWLEAARPGSYLAIQAFLAPDPEITQQLRHLAAALWTRTHLAVTIGYGPRYLHSTGQLHKGGPPTGLFLQLVDDPPEDVYVPGTADTFGRLIRAQADGDLRALEKRGRRVLRISLGRQALQGLGRVVDALLG